MEKDVVVAFGNEAANAADDALRGEFRVAGVPWANFEKDLDRLAGQRVIIFPMGRPGDRLAAQKLGEALAGVARSVQMYEGSGIPADIGAREAQELAAALDAAPPFATAKTPEPGVSPSWERWDLGSRFTPLGAIARGEAAPPGLLETVVPVYKRAVMLVYGPAGIGKSRVALKVSVDVGRPEGPVLYLDLENDPYEVAAALVSMGLDPAEMDEVFRYMRDPECSLGAEAAAAWRALLKDVRPALVVFDSWADFLSAASLDENSAGDVTRWVRHFCQPVLDAGGSVLLLDHVAKSGDGTGARGSGAKLAKVDGAYKLTLARPFDPWTIGALKLVREKDRRGHLPKGVVLSIGGDGNGRFVVEPQEGAPEEAGGGGLTEKQAAALEALRGLGSAPYVAWQSASEAAGVGGSTFDKARQALLNAGLVARDGKHYTATPVVGESGRELHQSTPTELYSTLPPL